MERKRGISRTAARLSATVQGNVSPDRVSRVSSGQDYTSQDLRCQIKALVWEVKDVQGVLIVDDAIKEKAWID